MSDLAIQETKTGKTVLLELSGNIDESADFSQISTVSADQLIIDLNNIKEINSWGVREWTKWVKAFPKSTKVTLKQCPQIMVNQINMIQGFMPENAVVESFYIPYFCNSCSHSSSILFSPGKNFTVEKFTASNIVTCEKCGEQAEWDVVTTSYFKFLKIKQK